MGKSGGKGNTRGFTLVETLTVAALLAILAAVAIPGVAAIQRRLEIARLDDYARQIFLAAQNEVTTMKASGELNRFAASFTEDTALEQAPADYPEAGDPGEADTRWMGLYHLSSETSLAQTYLTRAMDSLTGATDAGGCFILELDPTSGDIYSVFYAEKSFDYADVLRVCEKSRERDVRREGDPLLGYYGGSVGRSPVVGTPKSFSPEIEVHNGEELWVEVTCGDLMPLRATQTALTLTVRVEDEHRKTFESVFQGGRPASTNGFFVNGDSITVTVLLDSLDPEKNFAKLTNLTPGDDLKIAAEMRYQPKSAEDEITSGEGAVEAGVSSLFGRKKTEDGKTVVEISSLRHLNNLRESVEALAGGTVIRQTGNIDFLFSSWTAGEDYLTLTANPLTKNGFQPIYNPQLFTGGTGFQGDGMTISNVRIRGGTYTGLIAQAKSCTFKDVRLVNPSVSGNGNTGALAGYLTDSIVEDCRVFLENRPGASVDRLVETCTVKGGSNVGGLIGAAAGKCRIENSFAALHVAGSNQVGGLVGYVEGTVQNCYASGDVSAEGSPGSAGGLIGAGKNAAVSGCYASGNVAAGSYGGGLVGQTERGSFRDCRSYGVVSALEEEELGGFVGADYYASYQDCAYLEQVKYNAGLDYPSGVVPTGYERLRAVPANPGGVSHPYSMDLWEQDFPFRMCRAGADTMPHYGNWPPEFQLKTALVYYEKYATAVDGNYYGFYADVSLSSGGGADGGWNVNTLRQEVCVEDGYAVLSTYALTQFDYTLDVGDGAGPSQAKTLDVADAWSAEDSVRRSQAVKLTDGVNLTFTKEAGSVVLNRAKVYQLPFELQVTERFNAKTFWETLTLRNGYVGTRQIFTDYTFYYCPDFAKNAINPAEEGVAPSMPAVPDEMYVRSARQLNGLGRSIYYWNDGGGAGKLTFTQETDIDFGRYTKTYCGVTFDLMNTEQTNDYRNKPIGRPNPSKGNDTRPGNFRNLYNGQGRQIVDYCCQTYPNEHYRFTGLFGEIQGGTLENIVMVASDPEKESGYILSASNRNSDDVQMEPGVGALAGLLYVPQNNVGQVASVHNCAVSGYVVGYDRPEEPKAPAVGGLVGFSFGTIENSSAVCKRVYANVEKAPKCHVGGLVGSLNGTGTISNCYAGMTVLPGETKSGKNHIAGLLGGNLYTNGAKDGVRTVENCYTYCEWNSSGTAVYPVSEQLDNIKLKNCFYLEELLNGARVYKVSGVSGKTQAALTALRLDGEHQTRAERAYPWSESLRSQSYPFPAVVEDPKTNAYVHYGDWPEAEAFAPPMLVYYEAYDDGTYGYFASAASGLPALDESDGKTIVSAGYGVLCGEDRAFTMEIDSTQMTEEGRTLIEIAAKTSLKANGAAYSLYPLTQACAKRLEAAGWRNSVPVKLGYRDEGGKTVTQALYVNTLYGASVFAAKTGGASLETPFQIRTAEQLQAVGPGNSNRYFLQTRSIYAREGTGWIDMNWSSGVGTYDGNGYAIRGLRQTLFDQVNFTTLKNIRLTDVQINGGGDIAALAYYNHKNATILHCVAQGSVRSSGTAAGLVRINEGTIEESYANCSVEGENAAGFVWKNSGRISDCYAGSGDGVIRAVKGSAYGFLGNENWGDCQIERCYTVAATEGGTVFGFGPGENSIPYKSCYWAGDAGHQGTFAEAQGGTKTTLKQLAEWDLGDAWTTVTAAEQSHPVSGSLAGQAYPYPRLAALDHWGDWPGFSASAGKLGAGVVTDDSVMQGCVADSTNPAAGGTAIRGEIESPGTIYVVLLGPDLDPADWEVTYRKGNSGWVPIESITQYPTSEVNGYHVFDITTQTGRGSVKGLQITNVRNKKEVYTFMWEDEAFRYVN